ncbi:uncharacterized protein LOC143439248 [Arvicanthis niloticus]|uniref:uncharacterized protein LOC143310641 n=1 Tax=Arvicanthis niloticus TaxID=61156 RepID=UPI00402B7C85
MAHLGFVRTAPFFGFSLLPTCHYHRPQTKDLADPLKKCLCGNLSQKHKGLSHAELRRHLKACFQCRVPGVEGSNYKDLTGLGVPQTWGERRSMRKERRWRKEEAAMGGAMKTMMISSALSHAETVTMKQRMFLHDAPDSADEMKRKVQV